MTTSVRDATSADLALVRRLTEAAYAPYTEAWGAPPLPVTEDHAPRIARGEVRLLEQGGEPAGLIVLERHPDHLLIFSVAVAPERQHLGLGRQLLDLAEHEARQAGLVELRLYTNSRMTRNLALYAALGYVETGRRANPHREGWTLVDMTKRLPAAAERRPA